MCASLNGRLLQGAQAARLVLAGSVVFAVCHSVQSASAQPATSPVFQGDYYVEVLGPPERTWKTGPVEHVRGLPFVNVASSGPSKGSRSPAVGNSDIRDGGNGVNYGTITFYSNFDGYKGKFIGRYAGRVQNWVMHARGVYHGVDSMRGVTLHIRLTFDYATFTGKFWIVFRGAPSSD